MIPKYKPASLGRPGLALLTILAVTGLLLSSCTVQQPEPVGPSSALPQELNQISAEQLSSLVSASARQNLVPGAFVMVRTPAGTISTSYGTTELSADRAATASDIFRIGSVTKTMTAAIVLQLAGEKKVNLSDPIADYVPGVPGGENISLANLLQMRSGLHNYLDTDGFASVFDRDMTHVWTPQQLVDLGTGYPSGAAPGTAFEYSNTNTTLLGMVAEKVTGKQLAALFHDRLFAPLGMNHTELPGAGTLTLPNALIQGYQYGIFPLNNRPPLPADQQAAARAGTLRPNSVTVQSPSWSWAAGGAVSTAEDLMTWARALGSPEILSPDVHQMWLDQLSPIDPANKANGPQYGLGIEQIRFGANRIYFHEGELPGFNTFVATDPAHGVQFVIWTNLALSPDGQPTAKAIAGQLLAELYKTKIGTPALPPTP